MMKNKNKDSAQSIPAGIGLGVLICVLITLLGAGVLAWLLDGEEIQESTIGHGTVVILLVSSIIGTAFAIMKIKERTLVIGLLVGIGYALVLLACTALFFNGQYQGIGVTILVIFAGSIGTALLGTKMGSAGANTRHKIKNR